MANLDSRTEQKRFAAQTAYESLMSRALNYSGNVYDEKKYNRLYLYRAVSLNVLYNYLKAKKSEKDFTKLKSYLKVGLQKISKQKISIEARNRVKVLVPMIQYFSHLSQLDQVVSEVLELIMRRD